jgi:hypothetical protein
LDWRLVAALPYSMADGLYVYGQPAMTGTDGRQLSQAVPSTFFARGETSLERQEAVT